MNIKISCINAAGSKGCERHACYRFYGDVSTVYFVTCLSMVYFLPLRLPLTVLFFEQEVSKIFIQNIKTSCIHAVRTEGCERHACYCDNSMVYFLHLYGCHFPCSFLSKIILKYQNIVHSCSWN